MTEIREEEWKGFWVFFFPLQRSKPLILNIPCVLNSSILNILLFFYFPMYL